MPREGGQHTLDDLPPAARSSDPGTSWAGARDVDGRRRRLIDLYAVTVAERGRRGVTTSELQAVHGGESANIARRLTDLVRLGWIRHEGERRSLRTGRWQRCYTITATGLQHAAEVAAREAAGA